MMVHLSQFSSSGFGSKATAALALEIAGMESQGRRAREPAVWCASVHAIAISA